VAFGENSPENNIIIIIIIIISSPQDFGGTGGEQLFIIKLRYKKMAKVSP
jgi:hypothetical protein